MRIFQVDAFTKERFTGNPATVVLDADQDSDATLAAIAREFAHAETAFVLRPDAADHDIRLRFFNARKEAAFVGHATVAAHAVLLSAKLRTAGTLRQKSGTGIIEVVAAGVPAAGVPAAGEPATGEPGAGGAANRLPGAGPAAFVEFRQTAPTLDPELPPDAIARVARALGLADDQVDARLPARIARKGSTRLLIAVSGTHALNRLKPNFDALMSVGKELGAEGFFAFCAVRDDAGPRTYSRMFCPALGIAEDPVSGNAHAMLAAHLLNLKVLKPEDQRFVGHQGEQMRRPGIVHVALEIERGQMLAARIGGHAVIVSDGRLV